MPIPANGQIWRPLAANPEPDIQPHPGPQDKPPGSRPQCWYVGPAVPLGPHTMPRWLRRALAPEAWL